MPHRSAHTLPPRDKPVHSFSWTDRFISSLYSLNFSLKSGLDKSQHLYSKDSCILRSVDGSGSGTAALCTVLGKSTSIPSGRGIGAPITGFDGQSRKHTGLRCAALHKGNNQDQFSSAYPSPRNRYSPKNDGLNHTFHSPPQSPSKQRQLFLISSSEILYNQA